MMRTAIITVAAVVLASLIAPSQSLAQADEVQDQIQALRKKASQLKELGRVKVAEDLARQAAELAQTAQQQQAQDMRPNIAKERILQCERLLKDLLDKERRMHESGASLDDIEAVERHILSTERELDELRAAIKQQRPAERGPGISPEAMAKLEKAGVQIKHMRIAAENLEAAGAIELAGQIREKADGLEKEARAAKALLLKPVAPQEVAQLESIRAEVDALRKDVDRLRAEVKQIGQQAKKSNRAKQKK